MARGEGVKKLGDLFARYRQILVAPQATVIEAVREVVAEVLQIPLSASQVQYSTHSRRVVLSVPGTIKTEVMLEKAEILAHLKGRLGEKNAPVDII